MDLHTLEETPSWEWPEDADEFLMDILMDRNAKLSDRLLAAELAGEFPVTGDKMAEVLLSIVKDDGENEELRCKAVISLGPPLEHADMMDFEDPEDIVISEKTFKKIIETLRKLYREASVPNEVRRRILESSVRAPQTWHQNAVRAAYYSGREDWKLTAVFCMRFVKGFDKQIMEAIKSDDPQIEYNGVCAAGNWEIGAAWPHIVSTVTSPDTDKPLLLAAIEAAATIRPSEAPSLLDELLDSDDPDVVDAVHESIQMAEAMSEEDEDDDFV